MKVCLIYDFLTEYGGLERLMANHAQMLREEGFDVEILTCHIDGDVLSKMEFKDIQVTSISSLKTKYESISLASCYLGLNKLNEKNPDVFLSYSFPSNFMIRNKKAVKINYINHFPHFLYFTEKDKTVWADSTIGVKRRISIIMSWIIGDWLKKLDKRLVKMNDLNFANCEYTKKGLEKIYQTKMIRSYPVLDPIFKPSKKRIGEKFIFSSSRIIPSKKYEWMIEACARLKSKLPLYLSGQVDNDYGKRLEKLAREKGVKIKFLGKLTSEKLIEYYTSAEVFVFTTPKFEFGLVPAESLACGTPIVVWGDGGGQSEQVIEGVNGFLAKPYDFKDFAAKADRIIDSGIKKKNQNAIIRSSERFSYPVIKKQFANEVKRSLQN